MDAAGVALLTTADSRGTAFERESREMLETTGPDISWWLRTSSHIPSATCAYCAGMIQIGNRGSMASAFGDAHDPEAAQRVVPLWFGTRHDTCICCSTKKNTHAKLRK